MEEKKQVANINPNDVEIKEHRMQYSIEKGYSVYFRVQSKADLGGASSRWIAQDELLQDDEDSDNDSRDSDDNESLNGSIKLSRAQSTLSKKGTMMNLLQRYGTEKNVALEELGVTSSENENSFGTMERQGTIGGYSTCTMDTMESVEEDEDQIEEIVEHRQLSEDAEDIEYRVRWVGTDQAEDDWFHRIDLLVHAKDLLAEYDLQQSDLQKLQNDPGLLKRRTTMLENTLTPKKLVKIRHRLSVAACKNNFRAAINASSKLVMRKYHKEFCEGLFKNEIARAVQKRVFQITQEQLEYQRLKQYHDAAIKIQSQVRRKIAHVKVWRLRSIVKVQSWMRMVVAMMHHRRQKSMVIVQKLARKMLARLLVAPRLRRARHAAINIQKIVRGFLAKLYFVRMIEKLIYQAREMLGHVKCSVTIQRFWRGTIQRLKYRKILRVRRMKAVEKEFKQIYREEHQIFSVYLKPETCRDIAFKAARLKPHRIENPSYIPPMTEKSKQRLLQAAREEYRWAKLSRKFPDGDKIKLPLLFMAQRQQERRGGLLGAGVAGMPRRTKSAQRRRRREKKGAKQLNPISRGTTPPALRSSPVLFTNEMNDTTSRGHDGNLKKLSLVDLQEEQKAIRMELIDKQNRRRRTINRKHLPAIHIGRSLR